MVKYRFSDIAYNITAKKKPVPGDEKTYIGLEHLDTGSLDVTRWGSDVEITGEKLQMQKGDILFGRRNTYLRRAAIAPHDGIFSAHGMIFRPKTEVVDANYFPFFIASDYFMDEAIRISVGSLSPTVNWGTLKELEFVLPSLEKQKELAKILWAAEETKKAYKKLLQKTDELVKSRFIEMFYNKNYPLKPISEVVYNDIKRVSKTFNKEDTIQYLDISSIDNSTKTVKSTTPYILKDAPSRAQYVLQKNDILYSTVRPNLQNVAINPFDDKNIVGSTGFCILRSKDIATGYLWGIINSEPFISSMISQVTGANYPAVTDKIVKSYRIPIPPIELQNNYEEFVKQIDKSKFILQKSLDSLNASVRALINENLK